MVGIFSKLSVVRVGHRRSRSAVDSRQVMLPNSNSSSLVNDTMVIPQGKESTIEFKPVEHPNEPFDDDQPIQCPLPEPSILNDGRVWKERVSATVKKKVDILPIQIEDGTSESESSASKPHAERFIVPSLSAPEQLLNILQEDNASS